MSTSKNRPPFNKPVRRGYFAIGVEGISKPMNLGNLIRSAHAFGASFIFTIGADYRLTKGNSDTSKAPDHMPLYNWDAPSEMKLPKGCRLIGVELLDEAIDLPSLRHPKQAAYVMGPERGALSVELTRLCDQVVKIPTQFCINVATAGAIVMYDRIQSLGRFAGRPLREGDNPIALEDHVYGKPISRRDR